MDNKTLRVFGYVRVSTDNQLENYSIDEQVERIKGYCIAKGWTLLHTYTDGGFSGGNTNRPALQQLLVEVRQGNADAVVVYKLDRLSRSQKDTLTLIEDDLLAHGTDFVSINENFDTSSPFGRAMIGILSVFAQLEKDQITERFTMGRIGRSKAGYYHGGAYAPLGYTYTNGLLVVDPHNAALVQEIFDRFLAGESINHIWTMMEGRHASKWSAAKISIILKNSTYIGKVKFKGVEYDGIHEPIISAETFHSANRLLCSPQRIDGLRKGQTTPFRATTLLSGLIYCDRCGAQYARAHGCYKCYSRAKTSRNRIIDPDCYNDHWLIDDLDELVIGELTKLSNHEDIIESLLERHAQNPKIDPKEIHTRISDIDAQIAKIIDLYQISAIPMADLTARINQLRMEQDELRKSLDDQVLSQADIETFLTAIAQFQTSFADADLMQRRLIVSSLVHAVKIDGKQVKVEWNV